MDLGSEQSDVDMEPIHALSSIMTGQFMFNDSKSHDLGTKDPDQEKPNYSDISSLAEDDLEDPGFENSEEELPIQIFQDATYADFTMPIFIKASGEPILKLTELYAPLKSTQSHFDKLHLVERVCKTAANSNDYYEYLRSLKEYKIQLRDVYARIRIDELADKKKDPVYGINKSIDDYPKKYLIKKLRELEKEINELEVEKTSDRLPKNQMEFSKNSFFEIKHKDFTKNII